MLDENYELSQSAERSIRTLVQEKANRENISLSELLARFNDAIQPLRRAVACTSSASEMTAGVAASGMKKDDSSTSLGSQLTAAISQPQSDRPQVKDSIEGGNVVLCWLCACSSKSRYVISNIRICYTCFRLMYSCFLLPLIDTPQRRNDVQHFLHLLCHLKHNSSDVRNGSSDKDDSNANDKDATRAEVSFVGAGSMRIAGTTTPAAQQAQHHPLQDTSSTHNRQNTCDLLDSVYDVTEPAQASFVMSASVMMRMHRESPESAACSLPDSSVGSSVVSAPAVGRVSSSNNLSRVHEQKGEVGDVTRAASPIAASSPAGNRADTTVPSSVMPTAVCASYPVRHCRAPPVLGVVVPNSTSNNNVSFSSLGSTRRGSSGSRNNPSSYTTDMTFTSTPHSHANAYHNQNSKEVLYPSTHPTARTYTIADHERMTAVNDSPCTATVLTTATYPCSKMVDSSALLMWNCPRCTYINSGLLRSCEVCHYQRTQTARCTVCGVTCPVQLELSRTSSSSSVLATPAAAAASAGVAHTDHATGNLSTARCIGNPVDSHATHHSTEAVHRQYSLENSAVTTADTNTNINNSSNTMTSHNTMGVVVGQASRCIDGMPHVLWFCVHCGQLNTRESDSCAHCHMARYWHCGFCTNRHATRCDAHGLWYCTTCDSYNSAADTQRGHAMAMRETEKAVYTAAAVQMERAFAVQQTFGGGSSERRVIGSNTCTSASSGTNHVHTSGITSFGRQGENGSARVNDLLTAGSDGAVFGVNDACTLAEQQRQQEIKDHERRLSDRLARLNVTRNVLQSDGNCLFNSISCQLFGSARQGVVVRNLIVDYMHHHREDYSMLFSKQEWATYLQHMSTSGYWGDELCINAAARCFRVNIHVITSDAVRWHMVFRYKDLASSAFCRDKTAGNITTPAAAQVSLCVSSAKGNAQRCARSSTANSPLAIDDDADTLSIFLAYLRPVHYDDICCHGIAKISIKEKFGPRLREIIQSESDRAKSKAEEAARTQQQQSAVESGINLETVWRSGLAKQSASPHSSLLALPGIDPTITNLSSSGTFQPQTVHRSLCSGNPISQVAECRIETKAQRDAPRYSSSNSGQVFLSASSMAVGAKGSEKSSALSPKLQPLDTSETFPPASAYNRLVLKAKAKPTK